MFFDFDLVIPPNTPKRSPRVVWAPLAAGIIHHVEIGFPAGCVGLVYVRIQHGDAQIWPTNPDATFNTDDWVIRFMDNYLLDQPPYQLLLVGWNLDTKFPHTPKIRFGILPPALVHPEPGLAKVLAKFAKRFRL